MKPPAAMAVRIISKLVMVEPSHKVRIAPRIAASAERKFNARAFDFEKPPWINIEKSPIS